MKKLLFAFTVGAVTYTGLFAAPPNVDIRAVEFKPPEAERIVLKNGVIVYLREDHELPIFDLTLRLKSSPSLEPVKDAFTLVGPVWRAGGTSTRTPEQLNRQLEDMAADVSVSADVESAGVSLSCLSKTMDKGLEIFMDVLFHPEFRADQLALARERELEELRRQNETPALIARRAFRDALYGSSHPYAQNPHPETIKKVTRAHLIRLQKALTVPEGAIMSIAGDFEKVKMISMLEKYFERWKTPRTVSLDYDYSLRSPPEGRIFYVEKDFTQSRVIFGRVGPSRHQPEQYALKIADYILGGGGPSRLFAEIRSRRGLAYVVGSFFVQRQGPGMIGVVCQSMAPATIEAIQAIGEELNRFGSQPPQTEEVAMAKDATINSFMFEFDSPLDIASARASAEFYGYSRNYLDTYASRISELERKDIYEVGKQYYPANEMKVVVVGDKKKFTVPLSTLGEVVTIPLDQLD